MATIEKESNSLAKFAWDEQGNVLTATFSDGMVEKFDRRLVSFEARVDREIYGFGTSFQRLGACTIEEFPTKQSRIDEYKRRFRERKEWLYGGAATWDLPKKARGPSVTQADVIEAIDRAYPGKGAILFERKLNGSGGNDGDNAKTIAFWLATKQIAEAWANIQAERKAKVAESFGDADDEVNRLLAG